MTKKYEIALALVGATALLGACGGGSGDETAPAPAATPMQNAKDAVGDLEKAADTSQTLTFAVEGMT